IPVTPFRPLPHDPEPEFVPPNQFGGPNALPDKDASPSATPPPEPKNGMLHCEAWLRAVDRRVPRPSPTIRDAAAKPSASGGHRAVHPRCEPRAMTRSELLQ